MSLKHCAGVASALCVVYGTCLLSIPTTLVAADQKLDRKQVYELRAECGKSAVEFARRWRLCDGKGNYQSHYNVKLNVCFIHMTDTCTSEKGNSLMEQVSDVNENKDYAIYMGEAKISNDKPFQCYVVNDHCTSWLEFQNLIKPYMEE